MTELPSALSAYFVATNQHDVDAMLAPFAPDATVADEGETHSGHTAIREWMEKTTRRYGVTVSVQDAIKTSDGVNVSALVSGNFPGSPIVLKYQFQLRGGKIGHLSIGP